MLIVFRYVFKIVCLYKIWGFFLVIKKNKSIFLRIDGIFNNKNIVS